MARKNEEKNYESISFSEGEVVFGRESYNYQKVIDDFVNAKKIRIITYNISKNPYRNILLNALKNVHETTDVKIITNIPSRMPTYYNNPAGEAMKKGYRNNFAAYLERLNPENFNCNFNVAFAFSNHAKIIGTENVLYIGSANYSDESADNFESGTIITNKSLIKQIYDEMFPAALNEAIPYFEDDFNEFRLFALSMKVKFSKWLYWFDNHLIWKNQDTDAFHIRNQFELDEDGLYELNNDVIELDKFMWKLENTTSENDDEYNILIDKLLENYDSLNLEWIVEFTEVDSKLFELVSFDNSSRVTELIELDFNAFDENLEDSVENAMTLANLEYENMKEELEEDIIYLRNQICMIEEVLEKAHSETLEYADKWLLSKLDNT